MRNIIITLSLLISYSCFGQTPVKQVNRYGQLGYIDSNKGTSMQNQLIIPDTGCEFNPFVDSIRTVRFNPVDTTIEVYLGPTLGWFAIKGGSGGGTNYTAGYGLLLAGHVFRVDSGVIASLRWVDSLLTANPYGFLTEEVDPLSFHFDDSNSRYNPITYDFFKDSTYMLEQLRDVNIVNVQDKQILLYSSGAWVNSTPLWLLEGDSLTKYVSQYDNDTAKANLRALIGTKGSGTVTSVGVSAGTGISIGGTSPITSSGTFTVTNTAPDQTVTLTSGTGISVTGTYPSFTVTNTSPSSGGTVTSVGMSVPPIFSVTPTPITTSGTFSVTVVPQTTNYIWAGPSTGAAAQPAFRALVGQDLPTTAVTPTTYGDASHIPSLTIDNTGRVTAATTYTVSAGGSSTTLTAGQDITLTTGTNTYTVAVTAKTMYDNGNSSTAKTWDGVNGTIQKMAMTGNCVITLQNLLVGVPYYFYVTQSAGTLYSLSSTGTSAIKVPFNGTGVWPLTQVASAMDKFTVINYGTVGSPLYEIEYSPYKN